MTVTSDTDTKSAVASEALLEVRDLSVRYGTDQNSQLAVDHVSLSLRPGEKLGIVGESGSGKTTLGLALAGLLPKSGNIVGGNVVYRSEDLANFTTRQWRRIRGQEIAVVFQDAKTALDPVRTIGSQIAEAVGAHSPVSRADAIAEALRLLAEVELPDPRSRVAQYPHELSGGMRQRAMIAMALAGAPKVLVADEPTSALDVTTQANIMALLARLGEERQMSTMLITHDLGVIAGFADSVVVMYAGTLMESGRVDTVFEKPAHPYTRALIGAVPSLTGPRTRRLRFIAGSLSHAASERTGCRFEPRCDVGHGREQCRSAEPVLLPNAIGTLTACHFPGEVADRNDTETVLAMDSAAGRPRLDSPGDSSPDDIAPSNESILVVDGISKIFSVRSKGRRGRGHLKALDDVSLVIRRGEAFGIVGESGSGKTTLARIIVGLLEQSKGSIRVVAPSSVNERPARHHAIWRAGDVQMIFQDPGDSLDPLMTVAQLIAEPLEITRGGHFRQYQQEVGEALASVGLVPEMLSRRAAELSGGQRQRVAIARALTTKPLLLVADEAVASLDMSARGQVLNLLADIQDQANLTCVHISHDLSMVRHVCNRVAVMHAGRVVELASAEVLFRQPRHPYTAGLISAIPTPDPSFERTRQRIPVVGELALQTEETVGCIYRSRCPKAQALCATEDPGLLEHEPGHQWACHFPEEPDLAVAGFQAPAAR